MRALLIVLLFAFAVASIFAGLTNWDFFFEHGRARSWDHMIGRKAARILYIVFGVVFLAGGLLCLVYGN